MQVLYCRDKLGIPDDLLNVDGGAISIGHPYGMTGARLTGHALIEGKRRGANSRRHHVRRRRHGRGRPVRGPVSLDGPRQGQRVKARMTPIELIALAASTSLLAGWRLYLVTLVTGLAMKFGWVALARTAARRSTCSPTIG